MCMEKIHHLKFSFFRYLILVLLSGLIGACSTSLPSPDIRPTEWAVAIDNPYLDNFYRVDQKLYRSAQPTASGMADLEKMGINHVLNLRYFHSDTEEAKLTQVTLHSVPMLAYYLLYPDLVKALRIIDKSDSPVLVHCLHGSDRTGAVVAAYRMVFQHWSKEKAIEEMERGGFGFHYQLFQNIPDFLRNLDVDKLRKDVIAAS